MATISVKSGILDGADYVVLGLVMEKSKVVATYDLRVPASAVLALGPEERDRLDEALEAAARSGALGVHRTRRDLASAIPMEIAAGRRPGASSRAAQSAAAAARPTSTSVDAAKVPMLGVRRPAERVSPASEPPQEHVTRSPRTLMTVMVAPPAKSRTVSLLRNECAIPAYARGIYTRVNDM